jgi:hypothetical protein
LIENWFECSKIRAEGQNAPMYKFANLVAGTGIEPVTRGFSIGISQQQTTSQNKLKQYNQ